MTDTLLATVGRRSKLSDGESYSLRPHASKDRWVVWEDYRHGNWEIYFDDLP